jgi:glutathione reductase (NADPH)
VSISDEDFDADLFVIGGGSGGVRAARIAAGYGAKVILAEDYRVGGTCVIRGCVPKKLLVYAGRFADTFQDAAGFGWQVEKATFDWPTLIAAKDKEITRLEAVYTNNLLNSGVELIKGRAKLLDANTVTFEDGPDRPLNPRPYTSTARREVFKARHILIATGATPVLEPNIPGIEHAITSNEAFDLKALPERILIVGSGYIAIEFAGLFKALGSQVTMSYRADLPLKGFDADLRQGLADIYTARGISMKHGVLPVRILPVARGYDVAMSDGSKLTVDKVMVATGRRPNLGFLSGMPTGTLDIDKSGAIVVDAYSATSRPTLYAVGDVTNRANLTPIAIREGHAFADTVFGGRPTAVDHGLIPTAVFSTPEAATMGLSEADAHAAGHAVVIYKANFRPMLATLSGRNERTLMKLVVDANTDKMLGVHMLGPDAGEIIQMAAIAVTMGATKADFDRTVALHPSAAEEFVTMRTPYTPPVV